MPISYTHYVFLTLTYNRENCRHQRWWRVSRDTTAFIQTIRRKFLPLGPIEFLRVIERHEDYYPHVHLLLHFHQSLRVDNEKYFDRDFFNRLQSLWRKGFSKPEVLRHKNHTFAYVLKYFLKQIGNNTSDESLGDLSKLPQEDKIWPLKGRRITWFGLPIRILAWSRGMQYLYAKQQVENYKQQGKILELPTKLVLRKIAKHDFAPL